MARLFLFSALLARASAIDNIGHRFDAGSDDNSKRLRSRSSTEMGGFFSELGFQAVTESRDPQQFVAFVERLATHLGLKVENKDYLEFIAPFFNGDCGSLSFDRLKTEMARGTHSDPKCGSAQWLSEVKKGTAPSFIQFSAFPWSSIKTAIFGGAEKAEEGEKAKEGEKAEEGAATEKTGGEVEEAAADAPDYAEELDPVTKSLDLAATAPFDDASYRALTEASDARSLALQIYAKRFLSKQGLLVRDEAIFGSALTFFDCGYDNSTTFDSFAKDLNMIAARNSTCGGLFKQSARTP